MWSSTIVKVIDSASVPIVPETIWLSMWQAPSIILYSMTGDWQFIEVTLQRAEDANWMAEQLDDLHEFFPGERKSFLYWHIPPKIFLVIRIK